MVLVLIPAYSISHPEKNTDTKKYKTRQSTFRRLYRFFRRIFGLFFKNETGDTTASKFLYRFWEEQPYDFIFNICKYSLLRYGWKRR